MAGPTRCTFANTILSRGFDFTFGPGVQPSVCMLYSVPHVANLPSVGELRFWTGGEAPFVFNDCLVEDPRLIAGEQGQLVNLPVKDRRWKWQFGYVHGSYNLPRPDGTYLRERTPSSLIGLCLQALGETNWDASRIPDAPRPEIHWEGNAAAGELEQLCASLGCIVVLNPLTNLVEIWPVGEGVALPSGPTRGTQYAPVIPAQPQKVRVEAGPTLFQATFATEPVGFDIDGKWKPINDLSYKPSWGWGFNFPPNGYTEQQIPGTYTSGGRTLKKADLATATVYRCYRITGLASGGWSVPLLTGTAYEPTGLRDLQLFDELADEEIGPDGGLRRLPAVAYVKAWRELKALPTDPLKYEFGYSLDATHGILTFSEPLFQFSGATQGNLNPATVRFECSFYAGKDGLFHRHSVETNTGSAIVTPTRLVQRQEIQARVIYRYANDNSFTASDNLTTTTTRLNYWKDAALDEYGQQNGGTVNYQKLIPLSLDGLTQQITWSGGGLRPGRTVVSQAQRHNRYIVPLNEYRDRLAAKRAEQIAQTILTGSFARAIGGGVT